MKIGIDVSCLAKQRTGIGIYTYNLIENLLKIDNSGEYCFFSASSFNLNVYSKSSKKVFSCFPKKYTTVFWEQLLLPLLIKREKIDLLHSPNYVSPYLSRVSTVITVYDLSAFMFPDTHPILRQLRHRLFLSYSLKKSSKVITISENSKKDIQKYFGTPKEKIEVVYPGVSSRFSRLDRRNIKVSGDIPSSFFLYLGTLEPRKNLITLLRAFSKIRYKIDQKLVVVGGRGWYYHDIFDLVKKLSIKEKVVFLGYLPDEVLVNIYNLADLFVYPSLYEGFGLPPLEAMACGCPVITSNTSSLPEAVGDAGIMIDPNDVEALAREMARVLADEKLRKEMSEKGLARAKLFSWEKCARETLQLYEEIAKR